MTDKPSAQGNRFSDFSGINISLALFVAALLIISTIYYSAWQSAQEQLRQDADYHIHRLTENLQSALSKHTYLPSILAENLQIRDFLASKDRHRMTADINRFLEQVNTLSDTSDIYVMDATGLTLAASNWQARRSFINKNFDFRPYFKEAMQAKLGRYFAVGTTSRTRGYYFASPIHDEANQILGVMTVKIDIDDIEASWSDEPFRVVVTDPDGVIFMSNHAPWRTKTLYPLDAAERERLVMSLRYPEVSQESLGIYPHNRSEPYPEYRIDGQHFLSTRKNMPTEGWDLYIFLDQAESKASARLTAGISALLVILSSLLLYQLWKNQQQRRQFEQQAMEALETKVEKRTRELRKTQEDLVQAAKMAALGQLAAGINHELNNPLSAIRSYADNALQFLDRNQADITRTNLQEITHLTDRMAAITRQLKSFSRKSKGELHPCSLHQAMESAQLIAQPRLTQYQAQIHIDLTMDADSVMADIVWLEQILVNLLSNAAEAVQQQDRRDIHISSQKQDKRIALQVRDTGQGIAEADLPHIFEEFFTTKSVGKGLGLGLAISYRLARDMQGELSAGNHPEGGALFTLTLPAAEGQA